MVFLHRLEKNADNAFLTHPRIMHALFVPGSFIVSAVDAIVGVGYLIIGLCK
jgi:hypothetical protein